MTSKKPVEVKHGQLIGYSKAQISKRVTGESLSVRLSDGHDALLKTFNSFKRISDDSVAPIAGEDLDRLVPGLEVKVKLGTDGQLTGIFDSLGPRKRFKFLPG